MAVKPTGPYKKFDRTIDFTKLDGIWYPLVEVSFLTQFGHWIPIPLIFDTGATDIILLPDYKDLFPPGVDEELNVVGGSPTQRVFAPVTKDIEVEFLSQKMKCDVVIRYFGCHSYVGGLFGRECFTPFGFGFWESEHALYVKLPP